MRTRVPAALLLMLSWLLPAAGHAQAVPAVRAATTHEASRQAPQDNHPGARKSPVPPSTAQARASSYETTGGSALLPPAVPRPSLARAADARRHGGAGFAAGRHETTPARAPPSSTAL